jgi:heme exporter protein A
VKDDLTAAENLRITCTLAGLPVSSREIQAALETFGLDDLPVKRLSQGQRRRAALARLLLSQSLPLWLLDEPYAALDAAAGRLVEELIDGHVARGGAVVFTTHQDTRVRASRVIDLDA